MTGRIIQLSGGIAALSVVFVLTLAGIARADGTEACGFSGPDISCVYTQYPGEQAFEVPPGVRHVTIEAVGAPGGRGYTNAVGVSAAAGGDGARVIAPVSIPDGVNTLYVEVGGPGSNGAPQSPGAGGYNRGGIGGAAVPGSGGGGGGGASDVRVCSIAAIACPAGGRGCSAAEGPEVGPWPAPAAARARASGPTEPHSRTQPIRPSQR